MADAGTETIVNPGSALVCLTTLEGEHDDGACQYAVCLNNLERGTLDGSGADWLVEALGITIQPSAGGHGGTFVPDGVCSVIKDLIQNK